MPAAPARPRGPFDPRRSLPMAFASLALAFSWGCGGNGTVDPELQPHEERLVNEILGLIEVRIAAARDSSEARDRLEALGDVYGEAELKTLLDELGRDPDRGSLVVGAVHDSLEARRSRLLPPKVLEVDRRREGSAEQP